MKRETLHSQSRAVIRTAVWFLLLLAVAVGAWAVLVSHRARVRGIPDDFPSPVDEADVPSLGVNVALEQYDEQELDVALNHIADGGFVWVRQTFYWSQIETDCKVCLADMPHLPDWSIPDRILEALKDHPQLRLVAVLDDRPAGPPDDPARFATFARKFAARYGDQLDYYQIWDEPNLAEHWGGGPVNPRA